MPRIAHVYIGRVFNWGDYQNLRLGFQVEFEEGVDDKTVMEAVWKIFGELCTINDVLFYYRDLEEAWFNLKETVRATDGTHPTVFEKIEEGLNKALDIKRKVLKCLESVDQIPTTCQVDEEVLSEVSGIPLNRVEEEKKRVKGKIEEIEKHLEELKSLKSRFKELEETIDAKRDNIKELFTTRNYDDAMKEIRETLREVREIKRELTRIENKLRYI